VLLPFESLAILKVMKNLGIPKLSNKIACIAAGRLRFE